MKQKKKKKNLKKKKKKKKKKSLGNTSKETEYRKMLRVGFQISCWMSVGKKL